MRTINRMRAELVYKDYGLNDCEIHVTNQIKMFLKITPSYIETGVCLRKGCLSAKYEANFPLITMNNQVFDNSFGNLIQAILTAFPDSPQCPRCRHSLTNFERFFCDSIFIEVII